MALLPDSLKGIIPQEAWDSMTPAQQKKSLASLGKYISDKLSSAQTYKTVNEREFGDKDTLGTMSDVATMRIQDTNELTKAMRNLVAEGAYFAPDGDFQKGLAYAIKQQNTMFAQPKEGARAYAELALNVQQFNKLTGDAFNKAGNFTGKLADQAATLKKLGLATRDFTENLDTAIYDLGMGQKGVEGFNLTIKQLADDLDMLPGRVSQNFRQIAKSLMYESSMIKEEYAKLELLAQKTGLSATQIATQFGGSMDTIGGASSAAANLNAMLGRNAFSATQLLGMTESERAEAVRAAIQADANIMGDIQAGGVQGKFAMKSVAEALGMSGADARRFIGGTGDADSVRSRIEKGIEKDPKVGNLDKKILVENFKNPAKNLEAAINKLREQFDVSIGPERSAQLAIRRKFRESLDDGQVSELERIARYKATGFLTKGVSEDQARIIRQDPYAGSLFQEVQERAQSGLIKEEEASRIAKLLSSGDEKERQMGRKMAQRIRKTSVGAQLAQELDKIDVTKDAIAMSVVGMLSGMTSYGGRIMLGEVIKSMKSGKGLDNFKDEKEARRYYKEQAEKINRSQAKDTYADAMAELAGTPLEAQATAEKIRITQEQQELSMFKQKKIQEESNDSLELIRRSTGTRGSTTQQAKQAAEAGTTIVNMHVGETLVATVTGQNVRIRKLEEGQDKILGTARK